MGTKVLILSVGTVGLTAHHSEDDKNLQLPSPSFPLSSMSVLCTQPPHQLLSAAPVFRLLL